jgi:hypothetical protein
LTYTGFKTNRPKRLSKNVAKMSIS